MDDLNLYDDLDEFQEQQEKKSKELQDIEDKYAKAIETVRNIEEDNRGLKKKIQRMELSFQSLLDTARAEIKRKEKEIERLRKEKDDICFRRKFPKLPQDTTDSTAKFEEVANPFAGTNKSDVLLPKVLEQDLSKVYKSDIGGRTRDQSSDRFGESHKRYRYHDDRDVHYHKRQRNDEEPHMSLYSRSDNKWDNRKVDRRRDLYKNHRPQKTDYFNHERNRNRHENECHTEHHKTLRASSGSPGRDDYRKNHYEQYHNRKYSPKRRDRHDKYYKKSANSSERKEISQRITIELEKNGESPKRKNKVSLETSRQVKDEHSSFAVNQRSEEQSHSSVCNDVGPLQNESDVPRMEDTSKQALSHNTLNTSEIITNPLSLKNNACTEEAAVKESHFLEIKDSETLTNIVTKQQFSDECAIEEVSNNNILNERLSKGTQEKQNPRTTKNRNMSIDEYLYENLEVETDTCSQSFDMKDLLYENLDCDPCQKDFKQTDETENLEASIQQVEYNGSNADTTIVSETNCIQSVVNEFHDDDLPESYLHSIKKSCRIQNARNQMINDVDLNSVNDVKCSDTSQKPPSNSDVVCEVFPGCQKPSRNNDVQKSVREPSPSISGSVDSNKNALTNIVDILPKSRGIDKDSATTSSDGYSDCVTSSNKYVDRPQDKFDMDAFEKCFTETTEETDANSKLIPSEDLSGDTVLVATLSVEDGDKNGCYASGLQNDNTGLTNISDESSTNTSPRDYSIVVSPSREIIDHPQQSHNKIDLNNGFENNPDILLDHGEQNKFDMSAFEKCFAENKEETDTKSKLISSEDLSGDSVTSGTPAGEDGDKTERDTSCQHRDNTGLTNISDKNSTSTSRRDYSIVVSPSREIVDDPQQSYNKIDLNNCFENNPDILLDHGEQNKFDMSAFEKCFAKNKEETDTKSKLISSEDLSGDSVTSGTPAGEDGDKTDRDTSCQHRDNTGLTNISDKNSTSTSRRDYSIVVSPSREIVDDPQQSYNKIDLNNCFENNPDILLDHGEQNKFDMSAFQKCFAENKEETDTKSKLISSEDLSGDSVTSGTPAGEDGDKTERDTSCQHRDNTGLTNISDKNSTSTSRRDYSIVVSPSREIVDDPQQSYNKIDLNNCFENNSDILLDQGEQNEIDMSAFEKCSTENTEETDTNSKLISSEDLSGGSVAVRAPAGEDGDKTECNTSCQHKDNIGLTNISDKSSTNTSTGDYISNGLVVVTPLREIVDDPQQWNDKNDLDSGFENYSDILQDSGEQNKLKSNIINTSSEDTHSECFIKLTSEKEVDDFPQINNNNIDSSECCTSDSCGREQVLSNGDSIDLTGESFAEEVECLEVPVLHEATNSIISEDKDSEVDDKLTSLNNDVECDVTSKNLTEMSILRSKTQQNNASEETIEDNCDVMTDQLPTTNIETLDHDNTLTVAKKSDEAESESNSMATITLDLISPTKEPISKQRNVEITDDTSVIKAIQTESSSMNNDTKNYKNQTDENIVAIQISPEVLNETLGLENSLSNLSSNVAEPITPPTKEYISVEDEDIVKSSVGITDFNELSNEITEVTEVRLVLTDSDKVQDIVSKETPDQTISNLLSTHNLNLVPNTAQTNEIVSTEHKGSATENLEPKTQLLTDNKVETQNIVLETITLDMTSPAKEIISDKALLPVEMNNEIKDILSDEKLNVSELPSQNSISTTVDTNIEDSDLTADQLLTTHIDSLDDITTSVLHKERFETKLINTLPTDLKSIDTETFLNVISNTITENVKEQTRGAGSSYKSLSLCQNPSDTHKQHFTIQAITLDLYSPTKEPVVTPSSICVNPDTDKNSFETITGERDSATRISVSSRPNEPESNDLTPNKDTICNEKSVFDLQSPSKEHISNQTEILPSDIELEENETVLESQKLEQRMSYTTAAASGEGIEVDFLNSKASKLKAPYPYDVSQSMPKDNIKFLETTNTSQEDEYLYATDLKSKDVVAVESNGNLEDSNTTDKTFTLITKSTTLSRVPSKALLPTNASPISLTQESAPENTTENIEKTNEHLLCQSKEDKEDEDLYGETDQTPETTVVKDTSQQDCNILRETTVNIPGLDLLLSSENLEANLDASLKSASHKTTMLSDYPKCLKYIGENADVANSNHSLSGTKFNEFMNSNKPKNLTDDIDIDISPLQNAEAQVYQAVSMPGLDLLSSDLQPEFSTLTETGVNSTLSKKKAKYIDARPTCTISISPHELTDITATTINSTSASIDPETKESQKYLLLFGNKNKIKKVNEVSRCRENAIKSDAVTEEKDISKNVLFTLTDDLDAINDSKNNAKESETIQRENSIEENVVKKSQLAPSKDEMENIKNLINTSDDSPLNIKHDITTKLKDDLELRSSKSYKSNLQTSKLVDKTKRDATIPDDNCLTSFGRNDVCLPVDTPFVVDEFADANAVNDGKVLNILSQKYRSYHKVVEEINNNPETVDINIGQLHKCNHLHKDDRVKIDHQDIGVRELEQSSASQINTTDENFRAESVIDKNIKLPSQFNKPTVRMSSKGSPNLKSVLRKPIEVSREQFDVMNAYSHQIVSPGKYIAERSLSSNFDAIINFERNLSLVDKSNEQFNKNIEAIYKTAEKKKESNNNGDSERTCFKYKSISIIGPLDKLPKQFLENGPVTKFETNDKHGSVNKKYENETKNANTDNDLSENPNIPILSHKVSRILFTNSKIHIENPNNIPDLNCEEQRMKSMVFKNPFQTPKQDSESAMATPTSVQIITSNELQNPKMINSPSCKQVSQNLNFYQDQIQDSTVNNMDIAELPVCTTPKTPMRNISGSINASLNTLKSSTVSESYGLHNNLPSISTKCPTPPNFSGIFSKISFVDSGSEDAVKFKKKSPKLKTFIIPAASVLCNADNLQNATKASKKLHWETLENKNEMTEIEDDSDVNSTDEEQALASKECRGDKITRKEVRKSATNYSALSSQKDFKSIKEAAVQSDGNKFSELFATITRNLPKNIKLKKSLILRRNTIDTVPTLTDDTVEQFKQLTIDKAATNESISPYKVIKNQPQSSSMSKVLKAKLVGSSAVKVKCSESLMDSKLLKAATVIKSTKPISINMSDKTISNPGLNLAANCKKSKKINAKVQQLVPVQKKKRGRPPKQKIVEQNNEYKILNITHEVIAPKHNKERRSNKKPKDPDANCVQISEKHVSQNAALIQKDSHAIMPGVLFETCRNEEKLTHKLTSTESALKSTSANKVATNMNDNSACKESPVKPDFYNKSIIYDKLHSSDEQNSSVAENSEPECNKYMKNDGFHPTSKESIEPIYINDLELQSKLSFNPADKSTLINYKIPKLKQQIESTCSSDSKIISMEDISIKEQPIKSHLSTFRKPKTVSVTKEFKMNSCAMETYIHSAECEKTLEVQEQTQKHRKREITKDTFEGEKDKLAERCEGRQTKPEKKAYSNEEILHHLISNSRSKQPFVEKANEISTLVSKKENRITMHMNNDVLQASDQGRNNTKPRRKSMYMPITTENNDNLCDEYGSRKVQPIRKSSYLERNFETSQIADSNIKSSDNDDSKQHTGLNVRRKSVNTQRRILDTSSEDDCIQTPKTKQSFAQELKTKKDIIASDHKTNESISKSKTAQSESSQSIRSSSKNTKNEGPSKNETKHDRLPKNETGNSKNINSVSTSPDTNIYNVYGTGDRSEIYYQFVQARSEYIRLQKQLFGDISVEDDIEIEMNKIGDPYSNDKQPNGSNSANKNSNKLNKNIKPDASKERRKTIHALDSQVSNISENIADNVDEKSANKVRETRKTMFKETKSSKILFDQSPDMKLKKQNSGIYREEMTKVADNYSKNLAEMGEKKKPSKPITMRRKSMYTEKKSFDYTADHYSDHLQTNSDSTRTDLGRYQDGNSRKSTRNRRKSMYIERVPLISRNDTDTAPEKEVNEVVQNTHNSFEIQNSLITIKDNESQKLPKPKETNTDPRKKEHNVDTVLTEKIYKTYGSTDLNDKEIPVPNLSSIQDDTFKPIKSLRMLKKAKPSKKETTRSVERKCKIEDTRNSISQTGAEEDISPLIASDGKVEVGVNDSISLKTYSEQQLGNEEKRLDKSDDNHSDSDVLTIGQNLNNNKMVLRHLNLQRRIIDSSSSDDEEGDKIVNLVKTVIDNANIETPTIPDVPEKRSARKRRIVKVLSMSSEDVQMNKKMKFTPDQLEVATPASPTANHPIFNTHVTEKSQSHLNITPLCNDVRFQEIDSTLRNMFQSPQHETGGNNLQATANSVISVPAMEAQLNESGANITIDETVCTNRENYESSLNISGSYDSKSLNSSASQEQSATKHLSLGTSNYRFEKVSENVVNLFISRKRKRNKRTNNSNSDEHLLNK